MKYGYFDDKKREYIITNPKTPVKWINYVGTLAFGGFIDHTGGSLLCKGDPATNRITKYIPQLPASDFKGETAYLRIHTKNGYRVFSPYFVPTLDSYDLYECHVGLLYTRILSEFYGIRTEVTLFVPPNSQQLIRRYTFTNLTDKTLDLDFIPVVEYTHPDALKQFTNADWIPQTMQSRLAQEQNGMKIIIQYPFMFKKTRVNYFTSNQPVSSFETDRRLFLGDNEYGTWAAPRSLKQTELSNTEANRGDNICALMHHLGPLKPGEQHAVTTLLGQTDRIENALPDIERFRKPEQVAQALENLASGWDELLHRMQVNTPDSSMNSMLNVHNPRQCYITKNWS
ncbi:MAG: glycosyl transferase, partial [Kiritimatiellae bacterium]|nr:glycosyl transferase [Kiritimatiellia bacterium]